VEALRQLVQERLIRNFERFSWIISSDGHTKRANNLDLTQHVTENNQIAIDPQRPLWQFNLVNNSKIENQEKNTIFISIISREIDNGKSIIDIFNSINNKIDLTQESEKAIALKNIFLNKCLDRIGDALFLSSFSADQEQARKSIGAFYADELGIPNISKPVLQAKYKVEIGEKEISNSNSILESISSIFI
jgi:hypothetical protein